MKVALDLFDQNITRVRDLLALHGAMSAQNAAALDLSDLLRAHIVLAVSALDSYIHEAARLGMIETRNGTRPATPAYSKFPLTLNDLAASAAGGSSWFDDAVRRHHGWQTFQMPDKIAEAIRVICPKELWKEVALILGEKPEDVKAHLITIVDRRNKIAHEADLDPSDPGVRWPISAADAQSASDYISAVVHAIHTVAA